MQLTEFLNRLNAPIRDCLESNAWDLPEFVDHFFETTRTGFLPPEDELEFLRSYIGQGPFLDLGSGRGRLNQPLQQHANGVALDQSLLSLRGQKNAIQANLMDLPVKGPFSLALMAFGQACFLQRDSLKSLLKKLKRMLLPGGYVYLDLPTIELMQEMDGQNEFVRGETHTAFITREYLPANSRLLQRCLLVNHQTHEVSETTFGYQLYSLYELLELFRELRFRVEYGFEDFEQSPIKETSPWMVFAIQRI